MKPLYQRCSQEELCPCVAPATTLINFQANFHDSSSKLCHCVLRFPRTACMEWLRSHSCPKSSSISKPEEWNVTCLARRCQDRCMHPAPNWHAVESSDQLAESKSVAGGAVFPAAPWPRWATAPMRASFSGNDHRPASRTPNHFMPPHATSCHFKWHGVAWSGEINLRTSCVNVKSGLFPWRHSYGYLPVITGYKWDYTLYKRGYEYL